MKFGITADGTEVDSETSFYWLILDTLPKQENYVSSHWLICHYLFGKFSSFGLVSSLFHQ
jgi:hypothetical protein